MRLSCTKAHRRLQIRGYSSVRLTPAADNKVTAQIDFAGGAYVMSGTATKKEKPGV